MYNNRELGEFKELSLTQIISGTPAGMFLASDTPSLFAFSLHCFARVNARPVLDSGVTNFSQDRE